MSAPSGYTTVTASALKDSSDNLIANATIYWEPVLNDGSPTSFRAGGSNPGQTVTKKVSAAVTNGAFSIVVADTGLSNPIHIGYRVTCFDEQTGEELLGPGYECVQPTGDPWSFDTYVPNLAPQAAVIVGPPGPAPTLSIGSVSTGSAAVSVTGSAGVYALNFSLPASTTPGPAGPPLAWKGAYNSSTTYSAGDGVSFTDGKPYISKINGNTGNAPSSSPSAWDLLLQQGPGVIVTKGSYVTLSDAIVPQFVRITGGGGSLTFPPNPDANTIVSMVNETGSTVYMHAPSTPSGVTLTPADNNDGTTKDVWSYVYDATANTWKRFAVTPGSPALNYLPASVDQSGTGSVQLAQVITTVNMTNGSDAYLNLLNQGNTGAPPDGSVVIIRTSASAQTLVSNGGAYTHTIGGSTTYGIAPNHTAILVYNAGRSNFDVVYLKSNVDFLTTITSTSSSMGIQAQGGIQHINVSGGSNIIDGLDESGTPAGIDGQIVSITNTDGNASSQFQSVARSVGVSGTTNIGLTQGAGSNTLALMDKTSGLWRILSRYNPNIKSDGDGNQWSQGFSSPDIGYTAALKSAGHIGNLPSWYQPPKGSRLLNGYGDSITNGYGASVSANCWLSLAGAQAGYSAVHNNGVGGDRSTDMVMRIFNAENPALADAVDYIVSIGTNNEGGSVAALKWIYQNNHLAALTWLATATANKVQGSAMTKSGFSNDTTFSAVTGAKSTTNGATLTASLDTFGGPIYVYSLMSAATAGTFTVSVDGGAPVAVNCAPLYSLTSPYPGNGQTQSVQLTRITGIPAGAGHAVTITVTSATGSGNAVTIVALGTPGPHLYYANKVVSGTVYQQPGGGAIETMGYIRRYAIEDVLQCQRDGLDATLWDNFSALNFGDSTLFYDGLHPNDSGYAKLAPAAVRALVTPPGPWVRRGTPASGSKGTPGDVWAYGGYVYSVMVDGTIYKTAAGSAV